MADWFTGDTHFGHRRILAYCARTKYMSATENEHLAARDPLFRRGTGVWEPTNESIVRMDDDLIEQINKKVGPKDHLWHVGDFSFGPKGAAYESAKKYVSRIKCQNIHLLWGNHDKYEIEKLFATTHERYNLRTNSARIVLSHYAQAIWQGSGRGDWMLYGHSHSGAEPRLDAIMPGRKSMDVGVDNAYKLLGEYRPFHFDEIKSIFDKRTGISLDCDPSEEE